MKGFFLAGISATSKRREWSCCGGGQKSRNGFFLLFSFCCSDFFSRQSKKVFLQFFSGLVEKFCTRNRYFNFVIGVFFFVFCLQKEGGRKKWGFAANNLVTMQ